MSKSLQDLYRERVRKTTFKSASATPVLNDDYNLGSPSDTFGTEDINLGSTPEGMIDPVQYRHDVATAIGERTLKWAKEAPENFKDVTDKGDKLALSNPLALSGTPMEEGYTNTPVPQETEEQHQDRIMKNQAVKKFSDETIRPAATVAAVLGVPGAAYVYAPYMVSDVTETFKKEIAEKGAVEGLASGVLTNIKELTVGELPYYLTDKEFGERIKTQPALMADVALEAIDVLAGVNVAIKPTVSRMIDKADLKDKRKAILNELEEKFNGNQGQAGNSVGATNIVPEGSPEGKLQRKSESQNSDSKLHSRGNSSSVVDGSNIETLRETADAGLSNSRDDMLPNDSSIVLDNLRDVDTKIRELDAQRTLEEAIEEEPNIRTSAGRDISVLPPSYFKAVTTNEIIKKFNEFLSFRPFNFPLGIGKNVMGYHNPLLSVVRTRKYGHFGDYAHELGHYLDKIFQIQGADEELVDNARAVWANAEYKPEEMRGEGIAEFTREFLLNPEEAKLYYPTYYEKFTTALEDYPKFKQDLAILSDMLRSYAKQNDWQTIRGHISFPSDLKPTLLDRLVSLKDKIQFELFDDKAYLRQAEKVVERKIGRKLNPDESFYVRARLYDGFVTGQSNLLLAGDGNLDIKILNEFFDGKLKNKVTFKDILVPLNNEQDLLKKYPTLFQDWNVTNWAEALSVYLVAQHNAELYFVKGSEKLIKAQDAHASLEKMCYEEMQRMIDEGDYIGAAMFYKLSQDKLEASQLNIDNIIKHPYKVPIDMAKVLRALNQPIPAELKAAADIYHKFNDNILGILESGNLISAETREFWNEKYPNYCPFKRDFSLEDGATINAKNGESLLDNNPNLYKLSDIGSERSVVDPLTATYLAAQSAIAKAHKNKTLLALKKLAVSEGCGVFCEPVGTVKPRTSTFYIYENGEKKAYQTTPEIFKALSTFDNNFNNIILSLLGAVNKTIRVTATNTPAFIMTNAFRDTFQAAVTSKGMYIPFISNIGAMKKAFKNRELMSRYIASGVAFSTLRGSSFLKAGAEIADMTKAKNKTQQKVEKIWNTYNQIGTAAESLPRIFEFSDSLSRTGSLIGAAYNAKEITYDFTKGGRTSKLINRYAIPFFNVGMLSIDKLSSSITDPRFLAKGIITCTSLSLLTWQLNHEEDWYQKLPWEQKTRFWYLGRLPDGTLIKVPKPLGLNHIFCTIPEALLEQMYGTKNKIPFETPVLDALASLSPTGSLDPASLTPALVKPFVESSANYNFFRDMPIVPRRLQNKPLEEQYTEFTPEVYKILGEKMKMSPLMIEHYVNAYLTSTGQFAVDLTDALLKTTEDPSKRWNEYPIINRFTSSPNQRTTSEDTYFKAREFFTKEQNSKNITRSKRAKAALNNVKVDHKAITDMYREIRTINGSKLPGEVKREKIDKIRSKIIKRTEIASEKLYKYLPSDMK